ncbi:MFS transporter [Streptomyces sp. NPDC021100]|uniref:MFS transporter n=1 Tax=Streptomyces sp. NPDC021100 TaxID=3365114 RepID=UPI00379404F6
MPTLNKIRTALRGEQRVTPADPSLSRLRTALTVFFALDGFLFAGWVVRIPSIKERTGASAGALGLALLGVSAGAVAVMMLTGRLCRRFGSHPVTVATAAVLALGIALPPFARSAPALGLVLLVFGAAYGGINVAMNSAAVDLVTALRRPVMPSFHAAYSVGGMLGAGLGGLVAGRLPVTRHLLMLTAVGLVVTVVAGRMLLAHPAPRPPETVVSGSASASASGSGSASVSGGASQRPKPPVRGRGLVVVFGLIALCSSYGEGALADWGALHLRQDVGAGAGTAAIGYSVFALAMTVGRLSGTAMLERLGQTRTLVFGGATAAVGMLLASLTPALWAVFVGFALTGLGLANIFPVAIGRAGELTGPGGVAAASTFGYGGMLLGPPAIGLLADRFSLPAALTTVAGLAAMSALISGATRRWTRRV